MSNDFTNPEHGKMPNGLIPIDCTKPLTFTETALWYSRYMLMVRYGIDKHRCPVCRTELHFHFCDVYGDKYTKYVIVRCPNCKVSSDACYYPRYNISPVELSNGAIKRALDEFERRCKR
jgi:hypothetical protein